MGNNTSTGEAVGGGFLTTLGVILSFTPIGPIAGPILIPSGLSMMSGKEVPIGAGATYCDDGKGIKPFVGEPTKAIRNREVEPEPLKEYKELKDYGKKLEEAIYRKITVTNMEDFSKIMKNYYYGKIERLSPLIISKVRKSYSKTYPILIEQIDNLDTILFSLKYHYENEKSIYKHVVERLNILPHGKTVIGLVACCLNIIENVDFLANHNPEMIGGVGYSRIDTEIKEDYQSVLNYVKKIHELIVEEKELKIIRSKYETKYRDLVPEVKWKQTGDHSKATLERISKLEREIQDKIDEKVCNKIFRLIINSCREIK